MAQNPFAPVAFGIIVLLTACGDGGNTNSTAITAAAAAPLPINSVGSGLVDHSQKMTVAARATAE
uniref:hypothetical protein n=1 Tax=Sphingomonas sp. TZW2008 TaxID=1917973 RepID=UPI00118182D2